MSDNKENFLDKFVLKDNDKFQPYEDVSAEEAEAKRLAEENKTEDGEEIKPEEKAEEVKPNAEGEEVKEEGSGIPAQDIIKVLHEHNGWDVNEEALEKYKNSEEGLMGFLGDVIQANTPKPEFASDEVANFNEYVAKGGKPSEFLDTYYSNDYNYEEANLEDEAVAKKVYVDYLKKTTRFSDAKIAKEVQNLIDLDDLSEEVKEANEYMIEDGKKAKEELQKKLDADNKAQEENFYRYMDEQKSRIKNSKKIAGFDVDEKLADELFEFAFERDNSGKTKYDLLKEKNPNLDLDLWMLAMKGVDKVSITKEAQSEASKNLKKNLSNYTDKTAKSNNNTAPNKGGKSIDNYDKFVI